MSHYHLSEDKKKELEVLIRQDYSNIAGLLIERDGKPLYEACFHGCHSSSPVHVYSVTKSIVALLVGIAIDRGLIKSVNRHVLDFFPDYAVPEGNEAIQNITLKHLLTMTAPYKFQIPPYTEYFTCEDRVRFTLDLLGGSEQPGTFQYAPLVGPDLLTGILVRATGKSVLDFAREYLFDPLGIKVEKNLVFQSQEEQEAFNHSCSISGWACDEALVNSAGWGLSLSHADMAKIGRLFLNNGSWEGRQLLSSQWIAECKKEHSLFPELNLPYGYLWWIIDPNRQIYAAMGDSGNTIYINTSTKTVIAITSFFDTEAKDRIELIQKYLEPVIEAGG